MNFISHEHDTPSATNAVLFWRFQPVGDATKSAPEAWKRLAPMQFTGREDLGTVKMRTILGEPEERDLKFNHRGSDFGYATLACAKLGGGRYAT